MGLIENLKRHNVISKMIFAVYIYDADMGNKTNVQTKSILSIGESNLESYARGEFAYMRAAAEQGQWKVVLTSAKFGEKELVDGYSSATIELGVSMLIVPNDVYLQIQYELCWQYSCLFDENLITFKCDALPEELPDITLVMDQSTIVITPNMYMQKGHGKCQMLMVPYNSNSWILGTLLLKRYYAVFDMEQHRIGLAPSVNIPPLSGLWILWVFLILVFLGGMAAAYLVYRRKKNQQQEGAKPLIPGLHRSKA